jgi:transposase
MASSGRICSSSWMPITTPAGSRHCGASLPTNTSSGSGRKSLNASDSTRHTTSRDRTPGQAHDVTAAPALLNGAEGGSVIADRGYDTNEVRTLIEKAGMQPVIPSRRSRKSPIPHDPILYKARNRIEQCLNKLKHFRRFATRFDRRDIHFLSFIHLASAMLWMR